MNNKTYLFSIGIILFLIGYTLFCITLINLRSEKRDKILIDKIDKIELQIHSLQAKKDSIRSVIDSTHVKIITNEKHYQEVVNTIITQPTTADYEFIRGCIRQYRSQNDSSNLR